MKKYFGVFIISLGLACTSSEKKSVETKDSLTKEAKTVTTSFKDSKLQNLYTSYLGLKDALVAGKQQEVSAASKVLAGELKSYTGCENTSIIAEKISTAKDIVAQRKQFTGLSSDVIALFKHADLTSGTIFVQHCPMANNGDGGDWLSAEKKIRNPYYGSEMMECGSVVEEIKSK